MWYLGSRAESRGRVCVQVLDQETLAQPQGQQSKARQGRSGKEGSAEQSCGGFCWAAGSWVAVAPAGSWGCAVLCQLLM